MKQKYYSEHVYGTCDLMYRALAGADGHEIRDLVDPTKLVKPNKHCILHDMISSVVDFYDGEWFYDFPEEHLSVHRPVVREAGLTFPADSEARIASGNYDFDDKEKVYRVIREANERIIIPSVFHALFSDRNFIVSLQGKLRSLLIDDGHNLLAGKLDAQGKIKRVFLPAWVKKGIFFRDRGECQLCGKDISGLKSPFAKLHLDHIVPLADHGNNDPTNFQLACGECNWAKGATQTHEIARFMPYWVM
jgi:HNH endonuclease